jgi:hypothetical protein
MSRADRANPNTLTSMGYCVDDRVYIFIPGGTWGHDTYATGTVRKITKSGQLTVERDGEVQATRRLMRFNSRGRELAAGYSRPTFLLRHEEQDAYAQQLAKDNGATNLRRRHAQVLEQLADTRKGFDPVDDPAGAAAQLRSWADKLEAYKPPVLAPLNPEPAPE